MRQLELDRTFFEKIDEAIADIRAEGYHLHVFCHAEYEEIPRHMHSIDQTVYVLRGRLVFTIDREPEPYVVSPGAKLVLPRCVAHRVIADAGTEYLMGWGEDISWDQFDDDSGCAEPGS